MMLGLKISDRPAAGRFVLADLEFQLEPFVTIVKFLPQIRFAFIDHAFAARKQTP